MVSPGERYSLVLGRACARRSSLREQVRNRRSVEPCSASEPFATFKSAVVANCTWGPTYRIWRVCRYVASHVAFQPLRALPTAQVVAGALVLV